MLSKKFKKLKGEIKKHNNIFVMGHKDLDLDAIAGCLGISSICKKYNKNSYIIINDKTHEAGVKKILSQVKKDFNIINGKSVNELVTKRDLLIVVDVNKPYMLQDNNVLDCFKDVIVIDHHEKNEDSISSNFQIVDNNTSSTSEIIVKYLYFYGIIVPKYIATTLLSGIVLDTNDFAYKTTGDTFLCSHYLMKMGADNKEVQYLLKQDLEEYILRQRVIADTEIINKKVALAVGSQKVKYKKEELAKIADTLLEFNHIELSFVVGKLTDNTIGISARSVGKHSVGKILEKLGGGGDKYEAASRIEDKSLKEVVEDLKKVI